MTNYRTFIVSLVGLLWLSGCSHFRDTDTDKERAKLYLQMAADDLNQKQYPEALEHTLKALEFEPQSPIAYNHLALIYLETKRYDKAEEAFTKALELRPDYPEVFNNLGVLKNRQEHYSEAIPLFQKALASQNYPTPENAMTNIGYAYYRLNELRKAKDYHQRALDIVPDFCLANKNMGDIYATEKNFRMAAQYFSKAVDHCPLYQESQYKLALAWIKDGRRNEAKQQLQALVQRNKTGPYVERSDKVLRYLEN